jgi:Zn-dependent peptidase ImmA (M78 family)/transcriptional regulator with XRE-family HTH domain
MEFRGDLLTVARQARLLTQKELASRMDVTQAFISMIEDGFRSPSATQVAALSETLKFPEPFFFLEDPVIGTGIGEVFHRRQKSIPAKNLDQVHAWRNLLTISVRRLIGSVEWPPVDLPTWCLGADVDDEEIAAQSLRARWYVPSGPVMRVSSLIDRAGILIIPISFSPQLDAIGQWTEDLPPVIFVNRVTNQDRLRFTMLHEIGHLVLHQRSTLRSVSDEIEIEANRFASAFLMPADEIRPHLRSLTLTKLAQLKRHWRVAMSALLMRAIDLETILPSEAKRLWIELGRSGWKKREPPELDVFGEEPEKRYNELMTLFSDELGYTIDDLSKIIPLHQSDIFERILPQSGLRLIS